eukprot:TRINITY_DN6164_c0_g3_i1.p1 TRINITY_DN6164_c0_g3~~TRINITY_DN6164_c0_g3_i1.p1  ORF type:complete len:611 (+),score=87.45 TRINITY_DN6164_c0_g3_i1:214-2046(+)
MGNVPVIHEVGTVCTAGAQALVGNSDAAKKTIDSYYDESVIGSGVAAAAEACQGNFDEAKKKGKGMGRAVGQAVCGGGLLKDLPVFKELSKCGKSLGDVIGGGDLDSANKRWTVEYRQEVENYTFADAGKGVVDAAVMGAATVVTVASAGLGAPAAIGMAAATGGGAGLVGGAAKQGIDIAAGNRTDMDGEEILVGTVAGAASGAAMAGIAQVVKGGSGANGKAPKTNAKASGSSSSSSSTRPSTSGGGAPSSSTSASSASSASTRAPMKFASAAEKADYYFKQVNQNSKLVADAVNKAKTPAPPAELYAGSQSAFRPELSDAIYTTNPLAARGGRFEGPRELPNTARTQPRHPEKAQCKTGGRQSMQEGPGCDKAGDALPDREAARHYRGRGQLSADDNAYIANSGDPTGKLTKAFEKCQEQLAKDIVSKGKHQTTSLTKNDCSVQHTKMEQYATNPNTGKPVYRIESSKATITSKALKTGTPTDAATRHSVQGSASHLPGAAGADVHAGHLLSNLLGGEGNTLWNIFPQNGTMNVGAFRVFERAIADAVKAVPNGTANLSWQITYPPSGSTTWMNGCIPTKIVYTAKIYNAGGNMVGAPLVQTFANSL